MKTFTVAAALTLALGASAQLDNIPSCALSCFLEPLGSDGCEAIEDFECHCQKAESLFASVIPCVEEACPPEEIETTITAVEQTCKAAGVEVEVPEMGGASSSVAESSAEPTPTPSETEAPEASSTPAESTTTEVPSSSVSGMPTPSGNGTGNPSPTVSEFPGAAARATQAAGLLAAAGIALFAL